jgi:hypothetical protein
VQEDTLNSIKDSVRHFEANMAEEID